jgi:hypothetical protein
MDVGVVSNGSRWFVGYRLWGTGVFAAQVDCPTYDAAKRYLDTRPAAPAAETERRIPPGFYGDQGALF